MNTFSSKEKHIFVLSEAGKPIYSLHGEEEMMVLLVMPVDELSGLDTEVEEWEELESMVDSGVGTTVVGPEDVRVVKAG